MTTEELHPSELYTISRGQIQSYDMALGARLLWLINSQSFAFGIYAGLTLFMSPTPDLHTKAQLLVTVLPFVGAIISLFTFFDIVTSIVQMHKLVQNYKRYHNAQEKENQFPLLDSTLFSRFIQRLSPIFSALLFLAVWIFLILYDHRLS